MARAKAIGSLCAPLKVWAQKLTTTLFLIGLLGGLVAGCAPQTMKLGVEPAVDRLGALQLGDSGKADVQELLGPPQGEGMSRMPDYPGLRTVWAYDYVATEGQNVGMKMLFVFFDGEVYDGYLWFDATGSI